jgi:hypothetical protein
MYTIVDNLVWNVFSLVKIKIGLNTRENSCDEEARNF